MCLVVFDSKISEKTALSLQEMTLVLSRVDEAVIREHWVSITDDEKEQVPLLARELARKVEHALNTLFSPKRQTVAHHELPAQVRRVDLICIVEL